MCDALGRYSGVQRACWLVSLTLLLMTVGCATGTAASKPGQPPHDDSIPSQYRADLVGNSPQLRLAATASGPSSPRIGWVYRIEGQLDGQPVQYVGCQQISRNVFQVDIGGRNCSSMKARKCMPWRSLRSLMSTSNRQTLMSARNEALRAAEQRYLDQVKEKVSENNMRRTAGQKEVKVLNEINASKDTATWEVRHRVATGGKWQLFEQRLRRQTKAFLALTLIDAYSLYYQAKVSRYVTAPYAGGASRGFLLSKQGSHFCPGILQDVYKRECGGPAN